MGPTTKPDHEQDSTMRRWLVVLELAFTHYDVFETVHVLIPRNRGPSVKLTASQEIPRVLWNLKIRYRTHNSPPPVPILSEIDLVHVPIPLLEDLF